VPVARIVAIDEGARRPKFGVLAGAIRVGPDFDAPLEDFTDYR
jgi:antitoxin (DNA-binding transcriptional repressor) of toxin-antitoxin stability system